MIPQIVELLGVWCYSIEVAVSVSGVSVNNKLMDNESCMDRGLGHVKSRSINTIFVSCREPWCLPLSAYFVQLEGPAIKQTLSIRLHFVHPRPMEILRRFAAPLGLAADAPKAIAFVLPESVTID